MDRTNHAKEEQSKKMNRIIKRMHGGQKGFTLIELLVVIAILGVIAAVVALNIAGFFGRGTLQAANTELHQAQTAIIAAMADAQDNDVRHGTDYGAGWAGQGNAVLVYGPGAAAGYVDAADYVYGPFRASYTVNPRPGRDLAFGIGQIHAGDPGIPGGWGHSIQWDIDYMNWAGNST